MQSSASQILPELILSNGLSLSCSYKVIHKSDKAKEILQEAIYWNKRPKGNILGDALSFVTGIKSPSESLLKKNIIDKMTKILNGELQEMNSIEHVLDDEVEIIDIFRNQVNILGDALSFVTGIKVSSSKLKFCFNQ